MAARKVLNMLTKRRKEILDFIQKYKLRYGNIPTIREICEHFGLKSTNGVYEHLKALEKGGYIEITANKARSIIIKDNFEKNNILPIIGEVAAGEPIYPIVTEGDKLAVPVNTDSSFVLKVKGDSMINAGIKSGDMIVVDTQKSVNNKDIVVALLDGEVTLKRLVISDNKIELHPENENYNIIKTDKKEFKIIGKVTFLIRKF